MRDWRNEMSAFKHEPFFGRGMEERGGGGGGGGGGVLSGAIRFMSSIIHASSKLRRSLMYK